MALLRYTPPTRETVPPCWGLRIIGFIRLVSSLFCGQCLHEQKRRVLVRPASRRLPETFLVRRSSCCGSRGPSRRRTLRDTAHNAIRTERLTSPAACSLLLSDSVGRRLGRQNCLHNSFTLDDGLNQQAAQDFFLHLSRFGDIQIDKLDEISRSFSSGPRGKMRPCRSLSARQLGNLNEVTAGVIQLGDGRAASYAASGISTISCTRRRG